MDCCTLALIAGIGGGIVGLLKASAERKEAAKQTLLQQEECERQEKLRHEQFQEALQRGDFDLTCQCGKLAKPISGTLDRYKCPSCGNQFVGARHFI